MKFYAGITSKRLNFFSIFTKITKEPQIGISSIKCRALSSESPSKTNKFNIKSDRMNSLDTVVAKLKKIAPLHLAGSWDNVGLLVEPSAPKYVSKVMITNDLTAQVMEEAKDSTVDLIISYHPPIFVPLKRLTQKKWKERLVVECMENRIAVFSPHTSYDAMPGGVNDWLISAFDISKESVRPVETTTEHPRGEQHRLEVVLEDASSAKEIRDSALLSQFDSDDRLRRCKDAFTLHSLRVPGGGEEHRLQVACSQAELSSMLRGLTLSGCKNKFSVSPLDKVPLHKTGAGRRAELKSPISVEQAVGLVKQHCGLQHVLLATRQDQELKSDDNAAISSVAVCAGSGSGVLKGLGGQVDLLLTGELSHHEVLDATHAGSSVILTNHSNSERGFLSGWLCNKVSDALGASIHVFVSKSDADPLSVV